MSRAMHRGVLAAVVVLGLCTGVLAKGAFTVAMHHLKEDKAASRLSFSFAYPSITLPGALMGVAGNCRDFNAEVKKRAQADLASFRGRAAKNPPRAGLPGRNERTVSCHVMVNTGSFIGVRFDALEGWIGAAHPVSTVFTMNWTADGAWVTLDSLFKPGSGYLEVLSRICTAELKARAQARSYDIFEEGLAPKPANYARFVPQPSGLQVFFDQGQAATGAAGVQNVIVPWAKLADKLSAKGQDLRKQL